MNVAEKGRAARPKQADRSDFHCNPNSPNLPAYWTLEKRKRFRAETGKLLSIGLFWVFCISGVRGGDISPPEIENLEGRSVPAVDSTNALATVFFFLSTDCPISNSYAPEIKRLTEEFQSKHIALKLVYPNRDETADAIRKHVAEYQLPTSAFRDPNHQLVHASKVTVTPEVAVITREGSWVYRGRIDNRHVRLGTSRASATEFDLRNRLKMIVDHATLKLTVTKAVGCTISNR